MASVTSLSVTTCTLSFQAFQSIQHLYAALIKHALKSTGTQIKYNSLVGLISRPELLTLLPRALVLPSFRQDCTGVMSNFLRSRENVEIYASLFCSFDYELALRTIASGQLLRPSTSGQLSTSVDESPLALTTKPSWPVSDDQDRLSIFGRLSMSEKDVLECATPSAEEVHDAETLLRSHFGDPPFLPRVRALRLLVPAAVEFSDYAGLSRILLPLAPEELVLIAAAISEEIPAPRWSASQRSSVVASLARACAAIFRAADVCSAPPSPGEGEGAPGGTSAAEVATSSSPAERPPDRTPRSTAPPAPSTEVPPVPPRRFESARDIAARHDASRQVQQLRARH